MDFYYFDPAADLEEALAALKADRDLTDLDLHLLVRLRPQVEKEGFSANFNFSTLNTFLSVCKNNQNVKFLNQSLQQFVAKSICPLKCWQKHN